MVDSLGNLRSGLIVTRTPLRISFAGGGTDLPDFYERQTGAVLSTTINKYVYVTVRRHGDLFPEKYRLNYSETEQALTLDEIKNDIIRECLHLLRIDGPLYVSVVADLPAASGLGSSSSFAVGLLNALHTYRGERVSALQLAQEACQIEIDVLKHPIGKQDQYAAAFGGLNFYTFLTGGSVTIEPHRIPDDAPMRLFSYLMVFWTNIQRDANKVLQEQKENTSSIMEHLIQIRDHAIQLREMMHGRFKPTDFGSVLDATWHCKRRLAKTISNDRIDAWYEKAKAAGAIGGKLLGAGAGGFILLIVEPHRQNDVRNALSDLTEIEIGYESRGSSLLLPSA
ncbi:MAG TPA: GHMP kinase [Terriglobia bacterium]|nr:GHMP kinase [Terriglobia bacterium]